MYSPCPCPLRLEQYGNGRLAETWHEHKVDDVLHTAVDFAMEIEQEAWRVGDVAIKHVFNPVQ